MIYSVWDPVRHVYAYHRGAELPYGETPTPKHLQQEQLGTPADSAAWPLPADAVKIGEGQEARGMIAMSGTPDGGGGLGLSLLELVGLAALVYIGVKAWK